MTMGADFTNDLLRELIGQEPSLAFFGRLANIDLTPLQRRFFETQRGRFEDRFAGQLSSLIQGGTPASQLPTFEDFLSDIDFGREFFSTPPSLRPGSGRSRFAPPTRFLNF